MAFLPAEDVETRHHRRIALSELSLDVADDFQRLICLTLIDIQVRKPIVQLAFLREVAQQGFIHVDGQDRPPRHAVQTCQHVAVPIVRGVQRHSLLEVPFRVCSILQPHVAKPAVIPCSVIVRRCFQDSVQHGFRSRKVLIFIHLNGVHNPAVRPDSLLRRLPLRMSGLRRCFRPEGPCYRYDGYRQCPEYLVHVNVFLSMRLSQCAINTPSDKNTKKAWIRCKSTPALYY